MRSRSVIVKLAVTGIICLSALAAGSGTIAGTAQAFTLIGPSNLSAGFAAGNERAIGKERAGGSNGTGGSVSTGGQDLSQRIAAVIAHRKRFAQSDSLLPGELAAAVEKRLADKGVASLVGAWAFDGRCRDPLSRFYVTGSEQVFAYLGREKAVKLLDLDEDGALISHASPLAPERFYVLADDALGYENRIEERRASRCE